MSGAEGHETLNAAKRRHAKTVSLCQPDERPLLEPISAAC